MPLLKLPPGRERKVIRQKTLCVAFLAKNGKKRKDAIQARKCYVSEFSLLRLLRWLYKPILEKI